MCVSKNKVTIREVAKEAGVSVATVSRYLNSKSYVSETAEKRIKEVMEELNFKPNEIARGLAKKKSNTIALIIPDITNPFFPELVVAIEKIAKDKGYSLILINSHEESLQADSFWSSLKSRYIDGLILASFQFNEEVLCELGNSGIPFVRIDRAADYDSKNSIGMDNFKGAKLAVSHLADIGCKKIAHISGPASFPPAIQRTEGYYTTLQELRPEQSPIIFEGDFTLESGKQLTEQLIGEHEDVDGIFLANDMMAIGSLKALKLMGKKVPEEVALIGFDGIKLTQMVEPEISTIEQPIYDIGVLATNRLIDLIEDREDANGHIKLDVKLVKRESTLGFKKR
jgi:LacI family transcriptional regulator